MQSVTGSWVGVVGLSLGEAAPSACLSLACWAGLCPWGLSHPTALRPIARRFAGLRGRCRLGCSMVCCLGPLGGCLGSASLEVVARWLSLFAAGVPRRCVPACWPDGRLARSATPAHACLLGSSRRLLLASCCAGEHQVLPAVLVLIGRAHHFSSDGARFCEKQFCWHCGAKCNQTGPTWARLVGMRCERLSARKLVR